jgi:hypothetical protein
MIDFKVARPQERVWKAIVMIWLVAAVAINHLMNMKNRCHLGRALPPKEDPQAQLMALHPEAISPNLNGNCWIMELTSRCITANRLQVVEEEDPMLMVAEEVDTIQEVLILDGLYNQMAHGAGNNHPGLPPQTQNTKQIPQLQARQEITMSTMGSHQEVQALFPLQLQRQDFLRPHPEIVIQTPYLMQQ